MHSFPAESNVDAFYLRGRARPVRDDSVHEAFGAQFVAEREMPASPPGFDEQALFEFDVHRCLLTGTNGRRPSSTAYGLATPREGPPSATADRWAS